MHRNTKEIVQQYNKTVEKIHKEYFLSIVKLDGNTVKLLGFSGTPFGIDCDLSSQLGYTAFHIDETETATLIIFKSYKCKRVIRSPISATMIAFANMFVASVTSN